jgi:hypothetical protein
MLILMRMHTNWLRRFLSGLCRKVMHARHVEKRKKSSDLDTHEIHYFWDRVRFSFVDCISKNGITYEDVALTNYTKQFQG